MVTLNLLFYELEVVSKGITLEQVCKYGLWGYNNNNNDINNNDINNNYINNDNNNNNNNNDNINNDNDNNNNNNK